MADYTLITNFPTFIMKTIQLAAFTAAFTVALLFANIGNGFAEEQQNTLRISAIETISVDATTKSGVFSYAFKACVDGKQHQDLSKVLVSSDLQTKVIEMTSQVGCFTSVTSIKATSADKIRAEALPDLSQEMEAKPTLDELRMNKFQQFDVRKQIISHDSSTSDIRNALNENAKHTMSLLLAMRASVLPF